MTATESAAWVKANVDRWYADNTDWSDWCRTSERDQARAWAMALERRLERVRVAVDSFCLPGLARHLLDIIDAPFEVSE